MKIGNTNSQLLTEVFDKVKYFINNSPFDFDFDITLCKVIKVPNNRPAVGIPCEALEPADKNYITVDGLITKPYKGILWLSNYLDQSDGMFLPITYEIINDILYLGDEAIDW